MWPSLHCTWPVTSVEIPAYKQGMGMMTFALSTAAAATASALSALYVVVGGGAVLKLAGSALTAPKSACLLGNVARTVPFCELHAVKALLGCATGWVKLAVSFCTRTW